MLTTLPVTALIFLIKYGLLNWLHFNGLVKFSEVGLVITGGIFLLGFMLAGTLADYKESEKIPAEMASALAAIEDVIYLGHGFRDNFDLRAQLIKLNGITESIIRWFHHEESEENVFAKMKTITSIALFVEKTGLGSTAQRITWEQNNLRKLFARATVIKRTYFLATGYAFLEVLTLVIIGLLMISSFESELTGMILICFVTQIFVYMIRLIDDIDHPFEYTADRKVRAADIDLFPLIEYDERTKRNLE